MKRILQLSPLILIMYSCKGVDTAQVARVEQNFERIEPGMTREQVKGMLGVPWNVKKDILSSDAMECEDCELWQYPAPEDEILWPHIVFEETTGEVTATFQEDPSEYTPF